MSDAIPATAKEATSQRASAKRRITNLLKQSEALLGCSDGISHTEFSTLATRIRERLDFIQTDNEWVIKRKCQELDVKTFADDEKLEAAEDDICAKEEKYLSELTDGILPTISQLLKTAEKLRPTPTPPLGSGEGKFTSPSDDHKIIATRMAKLKFPTFSGDLREYRRFRALFAHFSCHLSDTERLYQLVESMDRNDEKKKIKACADVGRAWEILDEAYGDQDRLLEILINDIESIHSYETSTRGASKYDLRAMERFVEALQNFTTQVESLGMKGDLNGRMLLTQVRRRLPEEHHIQFLQSVKDDKAADSMPGLVKWLHSLLVLLQKAKVPTDQHHSHYQSTSTTTSNPTSNGFRDRKSVSFSTMSPENTVRDTSKQKANSNDTPPKCPLHPRNSNHYIKGCYQFRTLTQGQKFDILNANGICHRCGHNNCIAGKRPFNHEDCQFIANCQIPTCSMNTHFTAICPRVYGTDGYHHYDRKCVPSTIPKSASTIESLNTAALEFQPMQKTSSAVEISDGRRIVCALPTIMGYLRHGPKKTLVRILLDTGSQISLVREGIILKAEDCHMQDFSLTAVGGDTISRKLRVVDCILESLDGSFKRDVHLTEMKRPCGSAPIVTNAQISRYPHLANVTITESPDEIVDILLGVENSDILTSNERILGPCVEDPIAIKCPLGWYIQGGLATTDCVRNAVYFTQVAAIGELEDFLGLERTGLEAKTCKCMLEEKNRIATKQMEQSVSRLKDGTYQIGLPWARSPENLPNNFEYAVNRLKNLEKQFKNKPEEWDIYCKQMEDQLQRGVARVISAAELDNDYQQNRKMWFLPHFAVTKQSQTTPVRIVYDGKARFQGHSLNDYLAKGDKMNLNLFEVALRFREFEVGMMADISKMFQAIRLSPEDAKYHRYVFRKRPDDPIQVYELTTVTFGDKPSPTAAAITLRRVIQENAPDDPVMQILVENQFYVDDLNESVRSIEDAAKLKHKTTSVLKNGGFNIRKWLSNEAEICDSKYYPTNDSATVLGTKWNLKTDTLQVKPVEEFEFIATKRNLLKWTASYYDVFGILSGLLIRPKILLQKLWTFDLDWDTPISPKSDLYSILIAAKCDMQKVDSLEINRCLIPKKYHCDKTSLPTVSLHGFSDASEDAMGIGIWLRWSNNENSEADLTFVCARARLTRLRQMSIPRKELQAVLLLSRLMVTVEEALRLKISYRKLWTDSLTVISWLRGQSKCFRSYVSCRVGEITERFDPNKEICYVPTDQNVIDLVSRGTDVAEMKKVIDGPSFLCKPPVYWPSTPKNLSVNKGDEELKKFHVRNVKVLTLSSNISEPIIDPKTFSSWTRLVMVTARILSVKSLPRKRLLKDLVSRICNWPSFKHIKEAELYWIRYAQQSVDINNSHIRKLEPFVDVREQVYRVGGRIDKSPVSYDLRHPYLLPKNNHISSLVAIEKHKHALHGGHQRTANEIRKAYWIIGDTSLSKRVVHNCKVCQRHRGKPLQQRMANLPECRVTPFTPAFYTTMIDYLGPISVKINRNTCTKGYCCVFMCTVIGAVHLTCVPDLSTSAFLQALERFISVRGAPKVIISDNATCFRGADNEIQKLNLCLDRMQLQSESSRFKIEWNFGPPAGPHHQGLVERMVREVKRSMKFIVKSSKLSFIEWETVLSQISGLINSRPVTASSSSPFDDPPITPNHFLIGRGELTSPQVPCDDYAGNTRKRREFCNSLVDDFWKRWMTNIHKLSFGGKWSHTKDNVVNGDIVLVVEDNVKRGDWRLAEIVRVYPGDDDLVRVVDVKYADGQILRRPITKLVLLMKKSERQDVQNDA